MTKPDTRIVYGAQCCYWGPIQSVGVQRGSGLPCCPYCGGLLFEMEDEEQLMRGARAYDQSGHLGYVGFLMWARGRKCTKTLEEQQALYAATLVGGGVH